MVRTYSLEEIRRQIRVCGSEVTAAMMEQLLRELEALTNELKEQEHGNDH